MWRPNVARIASVAFVLGAIGCGGDGGSTGPGPGGTSRYSARIDGTAWASNAGVEQFGVASVLPGHFTLTGTQLGANGITLVLTLYNVGTTGTYPLGVGLSVPGGSALISSVAGGWKTVGSGADGTITITTLTASRMEGTFNFTAVAFSGSATGTKTVTDGSFALDVKPTGTVGPLPDKAGSKLSVTLNGVAYNAAEVSGNYSTTSGSFTLVANNDTRSFGISLGGVPATGVGTYALSSGSPSRLVSTSTITPNGQLASIHSSSFGGGSGSVTITSFTATRIKGTFTAVMGAVPGSGATGTVTAANGSFDIGRP